MSQSEARQDKIPGATAAPQTTHVYLMRHGQCEQEGIMRGQCDAQLSETGLCQMQQSAAGLPHSPDCIWSSTLSRCYGFAQGLGTRLGVPVIAESGLMEMNFGLWDGKLIDDLYLDDPQAMTHFWDDPWSYPAPGGETMAEFEGRIDAVWTKLLSESRGKHVLLVTHGGVIRHLISRVLGVAGCSGFYTKIQLAYGALVRVSVFEDERGRRYPSLQL